MKNVQVIDGAANCVYDIFEIEDEGFTLIFGEDKDIAFIEDIEFIDDLRQVGTYLERMWSNRVPKRDVNGIHGTLFYGLIQKKKYYPTLKDEEAINPNGSKLR